MLEYNIVCIEVGLNRPPISTPCLDHTDSERDTNEHQDNLGHNLSSTGPYTALPAALYHSSYTPLTDMFGYAYLVLVLVLDDS